MIKMVIPQQNLQICLLSEVPDYIRNFFLVQKHPMANLVSRISPRVQEKKAQKRNLRHQKNQVCCGFMVPVQGEKGKESCTVPVSALLGVLLSWQLQETERAMGVSGKAAHQLHQLTEAWQHKLCAMLFSTP